MTLHRAFVFRCDHDDCGRDALAEVHAVADAITAAQTSGWTVRRDPADARHWQHFCPWHTPDAP